MKDCDTLYGSHVHIHVRIACARTHTHTLHKVHTKNFENGIAETCKMASFITKFIKCKFHVKDKT